MSKFQFSDDWPGTDPWSDDAYGYRPFAKHLAEVLLQLEAPRGYVLGLHGSWGSGKTTALNFVRHFVREANKDTDTPLELVDFQPWMVSGHDDLIATFFRVLADKIKEPADQLKRAKRFSGRAAKMVVDPLVKAAVTVAVASNPGDRIAIDAGGEIAKQAMNQTVNAWLKEPTLQAAHADLVRRIFKSRRRFLIFIDDIDRLESSEIRTIMQMVKSVGQLPNVIHFLAYDRRIVWRALEEADAKRDGEPTFAEKIVQHEVELPHATGRALLRKLERETQFILQSIRPGYRWNAIIESGLQRWIQHPRDVIRFSNALRFAWPPLEGEIDPADVLALEGLRLFEPGVFDWIRANQSMIVDERGYISDDEKKAWAARFRESVPAARRDAVVDLMCTLFPQRSTILRDRAHYGFSESWAETVNRKGVAEPRGLNAYFSLFPSPHELPRAVVDAAVSAPGDQEVQNRAIRDALASVDETGASLVGDYLNALQFRLSGQEAFSPELAMLLALVQSADAIHRHDRAERPAMMVVHPHAQYHFLVRRMLEIWGVEEASRAMTQAMMATESAATIAGLFVWRAREAGQLPAEGMRTGPLITSEALDVLGRRALSLIQAEAESGALANAPSYFEITSAWALLEDAVVVREWLMDQAEADPKALAKIASGFLAVSNGETGLVYSFHSRPADDGLYDLERLLRASEAYADDTAVAAEDAVKIKVLRDGLRLRAGRADSTGGDD
ncbi:P-loop NTPase fold protein [Brevundimonas sp. S1H14]|uniref:KAP family P-loop NTPase fold protein n=1 Tax=Brevundimonas sp. S1H14 TaxID=3078084 RepID=UPI0039EA904A